MLVLTRRPGDTIVIGVDGEIVVTVQEIGSKSVKFAIGAPLNVPIRRGERIDGIIQPQEVLGND